MSVDLAGVDLRTETVASARLLLRPWRSEDADVLVRACNDPLLACWIPVPTPYTEQDAREYLSGSAAAAVREDPGVLRALTTLDAGDVVGSIGLTELTGPGGPVLGYWVASWARRRGYAAEATDALSRWAFDHGVHRVWLLAAVGNLASRRTAQRAGFQQEGVLRQGGRDRDGTPMDMVLYARLAGDPPAGMFG